MTEPEGIFSRGKKLVEKPSEELPLLKNEIAEKLETLKAENVERKQGLAEITFLMKEVLTVELENANLDRDIRLLIKQYLERKTKG